MIGFGTSGKHSLSVEHVQVVALYDAHTGTIAHLHMVTTMRGATPVTPEEAIAEARTRASRRHPKVEALAVALSNDPEHGRRPHCIDPKTKAFMRLQEASAT